MRHTAIEREARVERVKDLRVQGLSLRQIVVELEKEGYPISLHQVQLDLQATAPSAVKSTFPFWCFDKIQGYPNCCFCHKVHLPLRADGEKSTLYDYQYNIFKAMEENTYLAVVKSRQIGITTIVLYAMLYYAIYGFMKGYKSLIIPGTKASLSEDHIGNLKDLIEIGGYSDLLDTEHQTRKDRIIFKDKTEIRAMPSNTTTVRGLAVKFVFLDEAAMFDDIAQREILNSIRPLIATTKGRITMISTPKGRRGIFYAVVTSDPTWNKMYLPYTVSYNKLLPAVTIESEMKSPTVDFQQEYNNQFSTPENAVYTQAFIDSHKGDYELIEYAPNDWRLNEPTKIWTEKPDRGYYTNSYSECIAGVDVGSRHDYTSLVVLAHFDKIWKPLICKIYQPGWPAIIDDFEKLAKEFSIQQFAIDTTAMGKDFADLVLGKSLNIDPVTFTSENKTQMINYCKKLLQGQELSLPKEGCPELLLQFGEQQKSDIGGGKTRYSHPESRNDDLLWAWHLATKLIGEHIGTFMIMM